MICNFRYNAGPAIDHFQQVEYKGAIFWEPLVFSIGLAEAWRIGVGWANPSSDKFNQLRDDYSPGESAAAAALKLNLRSMLQCLAPAFRAVLRISNYSQLHTLGYILGAPWQGTSGGAEVQTANRTICEFGRHAAADASEHACTAGLHPGWDGYCMYPQPV